MPIYEYKCSTCGAQFELMQKFSDPLATHCTACGAEGVKKLVSNTSFQLKGSGWYVTDYGKGSSGTKPGESKTGDAKSGESKTGESKSGEAKSGEAKAGESKSSDSGASESKPSGTAS